MYFEFNEFNSNDYNLAIESIPPIAFFNTEEEQNIPITFAKENKRNDLLFLRKNLKGDGELRLSSLGECYLKVIRVELIEDRKNKNYTVYTVNFIVENAIYLEEGKNSMDFETNERNIIINDYLESEPILKIFLSSSSNNGNFIINGQVISIINIDEYVIVDSQLKECYDENGFKNNNVDLSYFPKLIEGENTIELIDGINRIEIIPNWRC